MQLEKILNLRGLFKPTFPEDGAPLPPVEVDQDREEGDGSDNEKLEQCVVKFNYQTRPKQQFEFCRIKFSNKG